MLAVSRACGGAAACVKEPARAAAQPHPCDVRPRSSARIRHPRRHVTGTAVALEMLKNCIELMVGVTNDLLDAEALRRGALRVQV
jgi:hypothetical protein